MKSPLPFIFGILVFAGCMPPNFPEDASVGGAKSSPSKPSQYGIHERRDRFDTTFVDYQGDELRILTSSVLSYNIDLMPFFNWRRINRSGRFAWFIRYTGKSWAFMESLQLLTNDKERMDFEPIIEPMRDVSGGEVYESIIFVMPESFYAQLDSTSKIAFRIRGQGHWLEGDFTPYTIECLKQFYVEICKIRENLRASP
jgi:hypothetical protein